MGFETDVKDENGQTALHQIFKPHKLQHKASSIIVECCRYNFWNSALGQLVGTLGEDLSLSGFKGFDTCFLLRLARDFKSYQSREAGFEPCDKAILSNLNHIIEKKLRNYTSVNCRGEQSGCRDCLSASKVMSTQCRELIGAYMIEKQVEYAQSIMFLKQRAQQRNLTEQ